MPQPIQFSYGPRLICGAGAAAGLGDHAPRGRILFVTDPGVRGLGLADAALDSLHAAGCVVTIFDRVEPDPSRDTVMAAVAAGQGADAVIGFGGGSPMDVAKLAAYLLGSGDMLDDLWGVGRATGRRLPLTLVPTTAGTGSEATPVTVITVGGAEKRGVSSAALVPDLAVLDATLTIGLPRAVTAATGIDALVHAIEAYTSARLKNTLSDLMAREAIRLIAANLRQACDAPGDLAAREAMLLASHLAGVAFANAPVAGVHALAYPLGGHFHLPHGLSNALMLPHVMRHNLAAAAPLYAELAPLIDPALAAGEAADGAAGLITAVGALSAAIGLPQRLGGLGIGAGDLDLLAGEAMKQDRLLANNPCAINLADARRMYEAAL